MSARLRNKSKNGILSLQYGMTPLVVELGFVDFHVGHYIRQSAGFGLGRWELGRFG